MDLNVGEICAEIARECGQNGTEVTITWNGLSAGATVSPVDGSLLTGSLVPQSVCTRAFYHSVAVGSLGVRRFNAVEEGDVILDFPVFPDGAVGDCGVAAAVTWATLDTARDVLFWIEGKAYRQKSVDDRLAQSWDIVVQGRKLWRTVLLKPQP